MPILKPEINLFPADLFEEPVEWESDAYMVYTMANREKVMMRQLLAMEVGFYCPIIENTWRSNAGRLRKSFVPLFTNYMFVFGDDEARVKALTTNCAIKMTKVPDPLALIQDLRNLESLITAGKPVTIEEQLAPGNPVRVKSGAFAGCEGVVVERRGSRRLLVAVNFLQQGASVELEDFTVEAI